MAPADWQLTTFAQYREPVEGETSYAQNAALKAHTLAAQLRSGGIPGAVLGDDSGLEVRALGGRPGVLSARYGGVDAGWPQRRALLLEELRASGARDRSARFVCALHFIDDDGSEIGVQRALDGEIATAECGEAGFSYDPIFWYPPLGRTFGELSAAQKDAVSHRGLAVRALLVACAQGARPFAGPEGIDSQPGM